MLTPRVAQQVKCAVELTVVGYIDGSYSSQTYLWDASNGSQLLGYLTSATNLEQKKNYPEVTAILRTEGYKVRPGNVADFYKRYYEMVGQPMPKRLYNNGRPRKSRRRSAA